MTTTLLVLLSTCMIIMNNIDGINSWGNGLFKK